MCDFDTLLAWMHEGELERFAECLAEAPETWTTACDEEGWTLLHHAAECGDICFMELLLSRGADPNLKSGSGYYPFYVTIETGTYSRAIAELFIAKGARVGSELHEAILLQDTKRCEELISKGFDLECTDEFGNHPLHNAVVTNNSGLTRLLLEKGANINCRDSSQTTPLHAICADRSEALLPLVLSFSPDLELRDYNGRTALIFAAGNAFAEGVNQLLSLGAEVNVQDHFGNTALHYAFENEEIGIAQTLISAGADVHLINEDGFQPFDLLPEAHEEL